MEQWEELNQERTGLESSAPSADYEGGRSVDARRLLPPRNSRFIYASIRRSSQVKACFPPRSPAQATGSSIRGLRTKCPD